MIKNAQLILVNMDPVKKRRAQAMMKAHQKGKGEFHFVGNAAVLRWPASNRKGEGDGFWISLISGNLVTCACPSHLHDRNNSPCKHLILLARLGLYHTREDQREVELQKMVVCSG